MRQFSKAFGLHLQGNHTWVFPDTEFHSTCICLFSPLTLHLLYLLEDIQIEIFAKNECSSACHTEQQGIKRQYHPLQRPLNPPAKTKSKLHGNQMLSILGKNPLSFRSWGGKKKTFWEILHAISMKFHYIQLGLPLCFSSWKKKKKKDSLCFLSLTSEYHTEFYSPRVLLFDYTAKRCFTWPGTRCLSEN